MAKNVHSLEWKNAEPASHYNLVVIGVGAAGLVTAAGLDAKVALIERHIPGGDCLNVVCVPPRGHEVGLRLSRSIDCRAVDIDCMICSSNVAYSLPR
jgi:choline dehydrogenase-like flavoprotein